MSEGHLAKYFLQSVSCAWLFDFSFLLKKKVYIPVPPWEAGWQLLESCVPLSMLQSQVSESYKVPVSLLLSTSIFPVSHLQMELYTCYFFSSLWQRRRMWYTYIWPSFNPRAKIGFRMYLLSLSWVLILHNSIYIFTTSELLNRGIYMYIQGSKFQGRMKPLTLTLIHVQKLDKSTTLKNVILCQSRNSQISLQSLTSKGQM